MTKGPADAKWPRLLSLSVHELRTPISVVAGYIRMVLKDPTGTLDDRYRRWLEEGEKSCARLAALVAEMSDLSALEAGTFGFKRTVVSLPDLLADAIAALPEVPDRTIDVELTTDETAKVQGDPARLKTAFTALFFGLRRELVESDRLFVRERSGAYQDKPASWIAIGDAANIESLAASQESLTTFNEWRGGCGLSLAVARRIIDGHGGAVWSPKDDTRAGAVVVLPHA